ncbi:MAG: CopD family protein [Deferrisomatales bacterium]
MTCARLAIAVLALLCFAGVSSATEEYADRTGQDCGVCHRDDFGGGPLTPIGEAFVAAGGAWPIPEQIQIRSRSPAMKAVRLALGFLHLTTAVMWFGTIFYVHVVLRPKYALGGLPRAEMRIAWISMAVLAATGVPLTKMRFQSPANLLATEAGQLLLVKIGLFLFLVASAAVATLFISPHLKRLRAGWQANDGREGRPAWVKVGDRIYDLTASRRWKDGNHFRRHQAGQDLEEALAGAPHGPERLDGFPSRSAAGEEAERGGEPLVRVFYVMAYVNLLVALGVLIVISLWRWG